MTTRTPERFRALLATKGDDTVDISIDEVGNDILSDDDVTIQVAWSSVNFKDALATQPNGKVAAISPLVPGIDLAGTVLDSGAPSVTAGTEVIAHAYDLGVSHHGGFAEVARVPSSWVVPLPDGLTTREAMVVGTAGYTAALSVEALEDRGLEPGDGPVLVTGATGGVGSMAVAMLARRGHEVVASTGKDSEHAFLRGLGASDVIDRSETSPEKPRPLDKERWAGAVDCVGGATLPYILGTLRTGAAVAASGNTGGVALSTTVFPFILRGVALLGIDSVHGDLEGRIRVWERIGSDLRPPMLEELVAREVGLDELPEALRMIGGGEVRGRTIVSLDR